MSERATLNVKKIEDRMNRTLQRLGMDFTVELQPHPRREKRGNVSIAERKIRIFDEDPNICWETLAHEILEVKFRRISKLYQRIINSLISLLEQQIYREKEVFLDFLPKFVLELEKAKNAVSEDATQKKVVQSIQNIIDVAGFVQPVKEPSQN